MPSKSKAQHNLMAMVAHDPKAAKRTGIPQSVGRDYVEADKGRKFGGSMKTKKMKMGGMSYIDRSDVGNAPVASTLAPPTRDRFRQPGFARGGGIESRGKTKGTMVKMARGGSVGGSYRRAADGITSKGKTKGKMVAMNKGGSCY